MITIEKLSMFVFGYFRFGGGISHLHKEKNVPVYRSRASSHQHNAPWHTARKALIKIDSSGLQTFS
jgi:hypothetical protein